MLTTESVEDYIADMTKSARDVNISDDLTRQAIIRGLRPQLRAYVLQQHPSSMAALHEAARVAEATADSQTTITDQLLEAIKELQLR